MDPIKTTSWPSVAGSIVHLPQISKTRQSRLEINFDCRLRAHFTSNTTIRQYSKLYSLNMETLTSYCMGIQKLTKSYSLGEVVLVFEDGRSKIGEAMFKVVASAQFRTRLRLPRTAGPLRFLFNRLLTNSEYILPYKDPSQVLIGQFPRKVWANLVVLRMPNPAIHRTH